MMSFQVYGDFNRPFCYALEERLRLYEGRQDIEWRPIQHVPNGGLIQAQLI
jgi:predicted DsbA family dithiol-disulfide isomerase